MSRAFPASDEPPFLSAALQDRLYGLLGRIAGILLLLATAAIWAGLVTWSAADPSLTQATAGRAVNVLGNPGAVVTDLMLQSFGFGAVFALLAPMLWGIDLIRRERVANLRTKAASYPLAVVLITGALASLPVADTWPLNHGCGGLLGDVVYGFAVSLLSVLNAERAGAVAGLVLFAAGGSALAHCTGLEARDIVAAFRPGRSLREAPRSARRAFEYLRTHRPSWTSSRSPNDEERPEVVVDPDGRREPYFSGSWSRLSRARPERVRREASPPVAYEDEGDDPAPPEPETVPVASNDPFDLQTDSSSRAIAARFAPLTATRLDANAEPVAVSVTATPPASVRAAARPVEPAFDAGAPGYRHPSISLLKRAAATKTAAELAPAALRGQARMLEDVLADFGVKGTISDIRPGPVVTLYELEPARGTKSSRVIGLADDIARSMSVPAVRVAVVPGRNVIGIELPNTQRGTVLLREILEAETFTASEAVLPLALGKAIGGEPVVADLARMPHLLVAGTTGSGKSVGVNAMILSLLYRHSPDVCRMLMIDPKMLELSVYNGIPHLLTPVVTDPHKAVAALNWVVGEMEERYKRMSQLAVRNIEAFNARVRSAEAKGERITRTVQTGFDPASGHAVYEKQTIEATPMPYIVVVVDEFADLMIVAGKEIETAVQRLAQMARAAGIHLIMATQRPSVDIITGTIKANFPTRISFKVASKIDSRTILNEQGAEQLLGQGDMLFSTGAGQAVRVHGAFVSDEEVERVAQTLRRQGEPRYVAGVTDEREAPAASASARGSGGDDLYDRAVAIVLRDRKASISYVQRRLAIGYNRAADLIERMEQDGLVGPPNGMGKREILAAGAGAD